jgi:hypothetical protein
MTLPLTRSVLVSLKQFSYLLTECSEHHCDIGEWSYSDEWMTSKPPRREEAPPESRFSIRGRIDSLSHGITFRADRLSLMYRHRFCTSTSMGFQCTACLGLCCAG